MEIPSTICVLIDRNWCDCTCVLFKVLYTKKILLYYFKLLFFRYLYKNRISVIEKDAFSRLLSLKIL